MQLIIKNMDKNYKFKYDGDKEFEQQQIIRETKVLLGYIFLNYWATEKQKEIINKKNEYDLLKEDEEKKKKYNIENIFNNKQNYLNDNNVQEENLGLVKYKKEKWYHNIFSKIFKLFKKW